MSFSYREAVMKNQFEFERKFYHKEPHFKSHLIFYAANFHENFKHVNMINSVVSLNNLKKVCIKN